MVYPTHIQSGEHSKKTSGTLYEFEKIKHKINVDF